MKAKFLVALFGLGLMFIAACNKDNTDILNTTENPTRTDTTRTTCDSNFYVRIGAQLDTSGSQNVTELSATVVSGRQPFRYRWSNGDTLSRTRINAITGTFSVTVTDANGCTTNNSFTLPSPTDCSNFRAQVTTNGNLLTANTTGGRSPYRYMWSTGGTSQSITTTSAGTYSVTIVDANNCTATQQVSVGGANCANFRAQMFAFDSTNFAMTWVSVTNGTMPYSFSWSNGATNSSIGVTNNGLYQVTVTDANGCRATDELNISWSRNCGAMSLRFSMSSDSVTVASRVTGGTTPYSYLWSNGATTSTIQPVFGAPYNLTVTDSRGCVVSGRVQY